MLFHTTLVLLLVVEQSQNFLIHKIPDCNFKYHIFSMNEVPYTVMRTDQSTCEQLCKIYEWCTHFTFESNGNCTLMTHTSSIDRAFDSMVHIENNTCYLVLNRLSSFNGSIIDRKPNCNLVGFNMLPDRDGKEFMQHLTYDQCESKCLESIECSHFVWKYKNECYMKTAKYMDDALRTFTPSTSMCGYIKGRFAKRWNATKYKNFICDHEYTPNDTAEDSDGDISLIDVGRCEIYCAEYTWCSHYSWTDSVCALRSNSTTSVEVFLKPKNGSECGYFEERYKDKSENVTLPTKTSLNTVTTTWKNVKTEQTTKTTARIEKLSTTTANTGNSTFQNSTLICYEVLKSVIVCEEPEPPEDYENSTTQQ